MTAAPRFGVGRVTRFYVPLLLQAFSQSLTYPLVAGIVTHGPSGVNALTAFSQGQMVMFMIGAVGGGLVTTGMVFARTWYGYLSFRRLNALMMGALLAVQCLAAMPPFSGWIFRGLFALPPDLAETARSTLLWGAVMNGVFFLRNVPMVVLFSNYDSAKANNATFLRIGATLACAALFPAIGWTGAAWGLSALTLGVVVEWLATWAWARPYVAQMRRAHSPMPGRDRPGAGEVLSLTVEQFRFTLPLSLGGFLLMLSPLIVAAFVGRTAAAADMLAVHYVALGVANPVSYAALRMQTVAIQFPPERPGDRRLLAYAVAAGAALGLVPALFATPAVGDWYFGVYQNVPPRILGTARLAVGIYSFICVIHAVRGRIEGRAAKRRRPSAVMAGQIAYTLALFLTLASLLPLGVPGWAMAVSAIFVAPVATTAAIYAALALHGRGTGGGGAAQP
ncbi:MAG: hypothetical protein J6T51_01185 [Kiritimatiellae bacterium]|nr:hypothetical protein [Kiritimatiellia bacterium]